MTVIRTAGLHKSRYALQKQKRTATEMALGKLPTMYE